MAWLLRSSTLLLPAHLALLHAACGAPAETGPHGTSAGGSPTTGSTASSTGGSGGAAGSGGGGGMGGATSTSSGTGTGGVPVPEGIVSMSNASILEAETHLAAAPNGFVVVGFIAIKPAGPSTIGVVFSTDDGQSFGPVDEVISPNGGVASDPVFAVDAQNNFYMTWIGYKRDAIGNPYDMHVYSARAPAGVTKFEAPIEVTDPNVDDEYDKPWITVTNKGTVIITYARQSTGGILCARSTDQGQAWQNAVIIDNGSFHNLAFPCSPSAGDRVYATYYADSGIGLRWSDDDGVTWPAANQVAVSAASEEAAFEDPNCVAEGNEIWISYGLSSQPLGGGSSLPLLDEIRVAHSSNGGQSIDARYDAHDGAAGKLFMLPQLTREPDGSLDLVYYAGQMDKDPNGAFRRSRSTDGGATFGPSVTVRAPITFLGARDSPQWLGDYVGSWHLGGSLYTSYVDNTLGLSHIAFTKVALP